MRAQSDRTTYAAQYRSIYNDGWAVYGHSERLGYRIVDANWMTVF
jgi:hypothetical protein